MKRIEQLNSVKLASLFIATAMSGSVMFGADWPQWRGPNRDAKASDFQVPNAWPKELRQKWQVTVGEGVATPALVGERLYVFSREGGDEVTRCLNVADGKDVWHDQYESLGATGPASQHSGPRSSPAVASGKVVTLGVRGVLSCLDAATGRKLWRHDDFHAYPGFFTASSPMIVDDLAIAQLGGRDNGAIVAYDLVTGAEKWKWSGPGPAYASPVLLTIGKTKLVIANTESKLVAVNAADGTLAWEAAGVPRSGPGGGGGRGMGGGQDRKAATPIVDGQTLVTAGLGLKAVKLEKEQDKVLATELWNNPSASVAFNTPVLKNGMLYGLKGNNEIFCVDAKDGKTEWTAPFPVGAVLRGALDIPAFAPAFVGLPAPADPAAPGNPRRPGGPGGRGGRGGGMGGGFGSIVDAGPVLLALTPSAQLIVFEPSEKGFKQLASYKVAPTPTYAYPVASGNRLFIKDKDSLILWTID